MKMKYLMWILVILILSNTVIGIGLSPAKKTETFIPGETRSYTYYIVNNEHKNMEIQLYANGGLGQYVEFDQETMNIGAGEDMVPFDFTQTVREKKNT